MITNLPREENQVQVIPTEVHTKFDQETRVKKFFVPPDLPVGAIACVRHENGISTLTFEVPDSQETVDTDEPSPDSAVTNAAHPVLIG